MDANAGFENIEEGFSDDCLQELFITTRGFVKRDYGFSYGSENLLQDFFAFVK